MSAINLRLRSPAGRSVLASWLPASQPSARPTSTSPTACARVPGRPNTSYIIRQRSRSMATTATKPRKTTILMPKPFRFPKRVLVMAAWTRRRRPRIWSRYRCRGLRFARRRASTSTVRISGLLRPRMSMGTDSSLIVQESLGERIRKEESGALRILFKGGAGARSSHQGIWDSFILTDVYVLIFGSRKLDYFFAFSLSLSLKKNGLVPPRGGRAR